MYKQDLALNKLKRLICCKTQPIKIYHFVVKVWILALPFAIDPQVL